MLGHENGLDWLPENDHCGDTLGLTLGPTKEGVEGCEIRSGAALEEKASPALGETLPLMNGEARDC